MTTTDPEAPTDVLAQGGNLVPLKADIKKAINAVMQLKAKRIAITGEINEIKSDLVDKGVPKIAFNRALADYEAHQLKDSGPDTLRATTEAYWIAREAMGLPGQTDMFDQGSDTSATQN